jgi:plastocyanin
MAAYRVAATLQLSFLKEESMRPNKICLVIAAVSALVAAAPASAAPPATITITHVMRGCHAWDLGRGAMDPTMSITLERGTVVKFVNNDVMPHRLVRTSGPKLRIAHANMNKMAATASARFTRKGVYRFTTIFGGFFPWAASMRTRKMYVLHLNVRVK